MNFQFLAEKEGGYTKKHNFMNPMLNKAKVTCFATPFGSISGKLQLVT